VNLLVQLNDAHLPYEVLTSASKFPTQNHQVVTKLGASQVVCFQSTFGKNKGQAPKEGHPLLRSLTRSLLQSLAQAFTRWQFGLATG
jgi:hypothetical protein